MDLGLALHGITSVRGVKNPAEIAQGGLCSLSKNLGYLVTRLVTKKVGACLPIEEGWLSFNAGYFSPCFGAGDKCSRNQDCNTSRGVSRMFTIAIALSSKSNTTGGKHGANTGAAGTGLAEGAPSENHGAQPAARGGRPAFLHEDGVAGSARSGGTAKVGGAEANGPVGALRRTPCVISNEEMQSQIYGVAGFALPSTGVDWFFFDGDMPPNDWRVNKNGQGYLAWAGSKGPPDVLGWARAVLALRVQRIFDELSKRYGANTGAAGNVIERLKREKRTLIDQDAPRATVREKEDQITAAMARLNRAMERVAVN